MGRTLDITNFTAVTIDQIGISKWIVDLDSQKVIAFIGEIDTFDGLFREIEVTFWATMPSVPEILDYSDPENPVSFDPPQFEPTPDTWYDLPSGKITELVGLTDEILAAVQGRLYP